MVSNILNKNIPVEKSSYLCDDEITFLNTDKFKHDESKAVLRFGSVGRRICRSMQKFTTSVKAQKAPAFQAFL